MGQRHTPQGASAPRSGTQTRLVAFGDSRAEIVSSKPFTACRGGNFCPADAAHGFSRPAFECRAGRGVAEVCQSVKEHCVGICHNTMVFMIAGANVQLICELRAVSSKKNDERRAKIPTKSDKKGQSASCYSSTPPSLGVRNWKVVLPSALVMRKSVCVMMSMPSNRS